jgi:hypothetical protein
VIGLLAALSARLLTLSRLSALALLGESTAAAKCERAREAVVRVEQAAAVADFASRYHQIRPALGAWPAADRPDRRGLVTAGRVALAETDAALDALTREAADTVAALTALMATTPLLSPLSLLLPPIAASLPAPSSHAPPAFVTPAPAAEPAQVLRGPLHVDIDPVFEPEGALLDAATRQAFETHRAPYLWFLSIREEMASELCALSMVEYDGMPLAFYRDFAKQAWDEMRHALFFFRIGVEQLPDFLEKAPADHPLLAGARRYRDTGRGLPVPREKNLYELTWNATLTERLVLMHIDTETPGLAGFAHELRSDFCARHPAIAAELELASHDEASHARFGKTWLEHLVPDKTDRKAAIERALLLRGLLMLTAFSHYQETPLIEMMTRLVAPPGAASA